MIKLKFIALFLGSVVSTMALAADTLESNCLELKEQCIYTALQHRDKAKVIALIHPDLKKQLDQQPTALDQMMEQVPKVDPISVEVPMDMTKMQSKNTQQLEKMYFYLYPNQVVRMRVIYDSLKPNAKVKGFWILPIHPD